MSRRKGNPGKADMLFSRLVRSRGTCERCQRAEATDTAHIVRRRYSATRCVEDNAWALCRRCHMTVDEWPHEHTWLVESTIGMDRYKELCQLAQTGIQMSSRLFWQAEVERLTGRCKEAGVDTRWRAA